MKANTIKMAATRKHAFPTLVITRSTIVELPLHQVESVQGLDLDSIGRTEMKDTLPKWVRLKRVSTRTREVVILMVRVFSCTNRALVSVSRMIAQQVAAVDHHTSNYNNHNGKKYDRTKMQAELSWKCPIGLKNSSSLLKVRKACNKSLINLPSRASSKTTGVSSSVMTTMRWF